MRMSARRAVIGCAAIVLITLASATIVNHRLVNRHLKINTTQNLDELSVAHALAISEWVDMQKAVVNSVVPAALLDDPRPFLVQAQKSSRLASAYAGYPDKRMIFGVDQYLPQDFDPTSRPWYQGAVASDGAVLTKPYVDATTSRMIMTFAIAVRENGVARAVIGSDVYLDDLSKLVSAIHPTSRGLAFLVSSDGVVVAHPDAKFNLKRVGDLSPALTDSAMQRLVMPNGPWVEAEMGGELYLLRGIAVPGTQWTLVLGAQAKEALASVRDILGATELGFFKRTRESGAVKIDAS